jgi:uncharacterized protein YggE
VSDHVKVTGSASRSLAPDGVVWRADAVERDEDPRAAVDRAGDVAQAAMAAGADRLRGPQFAYEGAAAAREELLGEAMADARVQAERLAAAADRRLGRVISVDVESDPTGSS